MALNKHRILFSRDGEPETNTILTLKSAGTAAKALEAFHRAVAAVLNDTEEGAEMTAQSSDDYNIGDFDSDCAFVIHHAKFNELMGAHGVDYVGMSSTDLMVTYDRLLGHPENYYPDAT
jgi:hypothetical protein